MSETENGVICIFIIKLKNRFSEVNTEGGGLHEL